MPSQCLREKSTQNARSPSSPDSAQDGLLKHSGVGHRHQASYRVHLLLYNQASVACDPLSQVSFSLQSYMPRFPAPLMAGSYLSSNTLLQQQLL